MSDNTVTLAGNITRTPEMKFLNSGQAVTKFSLAHNSRWKDRNNEWQEKVGFYEVVCYGSLAENIANSLDKGMRILVTGKLEQRSWETEDGQKRSVVEINADDIGPSLKFATALVTKTEKVAKQTFGDNSAKQTFVDDEPF